MAQDGMFGAISSGAASGAGMGATIGSIIPGVGTAVGAVGGAIIGGVGAGIKQNKANNAQDIPLVDPIERARLASLEQLRKSVSSGTDALTQQGISQQQNIGRSAQGAISKSTGGDVGSTVDALLRSQKSTQGGVNQLVAANQNRLPYFDNAVSQMGSRISQRKLELGLLDRSQAVAENAQARTDNNINSQALLATQGGTQTIPEGLSQVGEQLSTMITNKRNAVNPMELNTVQQIPNIPAPEIAPLSPTPSTYMPVNSLPTKSLQSFQPQIVPFGG